MPKLRLSQDKDADALLSKSPLALLIGMVLDQQIPLEWAFKGPHTLQQRLGRPLKAADLAATDPAELERAFAGPPAIHRFPAANAKRVQELCRIVTEQYGGKAERVWTSATSGDELLRNVKALPGFGEQKAKIFVALLGKQLGVTPDGWAEAAGDYAEDGSYRSVADVVDARSLERVRAFKKEKKAAAK
jgi:uncharacterized HhH-GPD family protein